MNHASRSYAALLFPFLRKEDPDKDFTKMMEKLPAYMNELDKVIARLPENGSNKQGVVLNFGRGRTITVSSDTFRENGEPKKLKQSIEIDDRGIKKVTERTSLKFINNEFHFERVVTKERDPEKEKPQFAKVTRTPVTQVTKDIGTKFMESTLSLQEKRAYVVMLSAEPGGVSDRRDNAPSEKTSVQMKANELLARQDFSNKSLVELMDEIDHSPLGETPKDRVEVQMKNMKVSVNFLPDETGTTKESLLSQDKSEQKSLPTAEPTQEEKPQENVVKNSQPQMQQEGPDIN